MRIPFTPEQKQKIIDAASCKDVTAKLEESGRGYIKFPLTKKNGTKRWIHAPHYIVKNAQKTILENIPSPSVKLFGYEVITGFVPGRSILDNAQPHVGKPVVLSIDLKNFFPSIHRIAITKALSLIDPMSYRPWKEIGTDLSKVFNLLTTAKGALPQGAPTSPMLANWCVVEGDLALVEYCEEKKIDYTRYADDLTFSTVRSSITDEEFNDILNIINTKFGINVKAAGNKIKFMRSHKQQRVTGIVVNRKMSIPRARRRKLRAFMHDASLNGMAAALARESRSSHEIMGEMSFLHLAHPDQAKSYIAALKELC